MTPRKIFFTAATLIFILGLIWFYAKGSNTSYAQKLALKNPDYTFEAMGKTFRYYTTTDLLREMYVQQKFRSDSFNIQPDSLSTNVLNYGDKIFESYQKMFPGISINRDDIFRRVLRILGIIDVCPGLPPGVDPLDPNSPPIGPVSKWGTLAFKNFIVSKLSPRVLNLSLIDDNNVVYPYVRSSKNEDIFENIAFLESNAPDGIIRFAGELDLEGRIIKINVPIPYGR